MTYFADLAVCTYFPFEDDDHLRAVGWLDAEHRFPTGALEMDLVSRLFAMTGNPWEPCHAMGFHACELCDDPQFGRTVTFDGQEVTVGCVNLFIPGESIIYVAPSLVLHYILEHRYQPPLEFTHAVRSCPEIRSAKYISAIKRNGPAWVGSGMWSSMSPSD